MISGFYTMDASVSNIDNSTNPVGELSELGRTYARNVTTYFGSNGFLEVFNTGQLTGNQTDILQQALTNVAGLLSNIVNYNTSSGTILADIAAELGSSVSGVAIGNTVLNPVDNVLYPEWIAFTSTQLAVSFEFKIWLVNTAFLADYPYGQFELIYPVTNLALLYTDFETSKNTVSLLNPTSLISLASQRIHHSVTGYTSFTIRVYNRLDQAQFFDLPILVAYNGGNLYNTQSAFLEQFKTEVLQSGILTLEDWLVVIPSLIPVNSYYVLPTWDNVAVSNLALIAPLGSPTIAPFTGVSIATRYFAEYTQPEVVNYLNYSVVLYKSLGVYVLPDIGNLDGRIPFRTKFHDYFLVPLSNINIEQMSVLTQNMTVLLDQLVRFAETYIDGQLILDEAISIQHHGIYTYVCKTVNSIKLCVLTRATALTT